MHRVGTCSSYMVDNLVYYLPHDGRCYCAGGGSRDFRQEARYVILFSSHWIYLDTSIRLLCPTEKCLFIRLHTIPHGM